MKVFMFDIRKNVVDEMSPEQVRTHFPFYTNPPDAALEELSKGSIIRTRDYIYCSDFHRLEFYLTGSPVPPGACLIECHDLLDFKKATRTPIPTFFPPHSFDVWSGKVSSEQSTPVAEKKPVLPPIRERAAAELRHAQEAKERKEQEALNKAGAKFKRALAETLQIPTNDPRIVETGLYLLGEVNGKKALLHSIENLHFCMFLDADLDLGLCYVHAQPKEEADVFGKIISSGSMTTVWTLFEYIPNLEALGKHIGRYDSERLRLGWL